MRPFALLLTCAAMLGLLPASAHGQIRVPNWEVEIHGSFAASIDSLTGLDKAPPGGQAFTLADGTTQSRAVNSWFFGAGAGFLNQVLALRGVSARIASLGSPWPVASYKPGMQVGARVARRVTDSVWLEFSANFGLDTLGFDAGGEDQIEAARASFVTAFTALAASTPTLLPAPTVSATASLRSGGRRLAVTGVVQYRGTGRGFQPFILGGAGFAIPVGRPTTVSLVGHYELTTPGGATFDETDTVTLRYHASKSFVIVTGFGYMGPLSARSGVRMEARMQFGRVGFDALLDAQPSVNATSPFGAAILNSTNPGLQFATNGLRPNLSAPPVAGFPALTAGGRQTQWIISAGYYRRF
jgi:hypothetical protein